ncbi:uncharacterized protein LOC142170188 [Nicotiana tabacum]|uniref:Uncharacterized protein LOC142170188 n=1 Tax=Nicotiana tabacum TaxID=4097 RepID=A0AC58ST19_TOBAC
MPHPVNFIIWNIRGGNNDAFRVNFREMIDTHKPSVVTLVETRMEIHVSLLNDFPFTQMIEVPTEGQSGGMVILWKSDVVTVKDFVRRNQDIHANIEVCPLNISWLFSSIYASTKVASRNNLWSNIEGIYEHYKGHWLLGGDFNDTFFMDDKFGGRRVNSRRSSRLWSSVNHCNLFDLVLKVVNIRGLIIVESLTN